MGNNTEEQITAEDLKAELPEQDYEALTLGEDTVAVRCLLKAKTAVKAMILSTGHQYDEVNEVCRLCVLKYGLYELYSFAGQGSRAREIYDDCMLLIESAFGVIAKKTDAATSGPAVGAMHCGRKSPMERRGH